MRIFSLPTRASATRCLTGRHGLAAMLLIALIAPVHADTNAKHGSPAKFIRSSEAEQGEQIFRLVAEAVYRSDPAWKVPGQQARLWQNKAISEGALPNPVFTSGLFNVPFDGLSLTDIPTTQWRFGLKQAVPRGKTRQLKADKAREQAESLLWQAKAVFLQRVRQAQRLWLDLFFLAEKRRIVQANHDLLQALTQVAENKLAEGRGNQQDVIQARVEMLRLQDELIQIKDQMHSKETQYHALAGHGDPQWPDLPLQATLPEVGVEDIRQHPQIRRLDRLLAVADTGISLAHEQRKPMWVVGGEYRKRFGTNPDGSDREDLFAITASIDLPFARAKARDAEVEAALSARDAWQSEREKTWLQLQAEASSATSSLKLAREAGALYQTRLLDEARLNVQAAEDAYAAGTGDFSAVIIAQRNLLKTQLQAVGHQVAQWRAWVDLQAIKSHWLNVFQDLKPIVKANQEKE